MEEILNEEDGGVSQFSLQAFIKAIRKNLLLIVAMTVLCTALGGVIGRFFIKTQYTSISTMIVVAEQGEDLTLSESQSLAVAIKSLLTPENNYIYERVQKRFNENKPSGAPDVTVKELKGALTVDVESMMLTFDFTSQNPEAQYILELFMAELEDYINVQTSFYGGRLEILSEQSKAENDEQMKVIKFMLVFMLLGGFVSLLGVFLKVLLNDTYQDKESLENDLNVEVLAEIEDGYTSKSGR